jgi:hypothetical protein
VIEGVIRDANKEVFNPAGLNVLSPRLVALQFVSPASLSSGCKLEGS